MIDNHYVIPENCSMGVRKGELFHRCGLQQLK
jgi:hypothetical protein